MQTYWLSRNEVLIEPKYIIMITLEAVALHSGEGASYWVLGDHYTFKITGNETNGAFTLIEQIIQPQSGPPPHIHHQEDEIFYILHGKFSFLCGNQQNEFHTGATVFIPRGTLHTFKNIDNNQGKLLVLISPAGLEKFFYTIGTPATHTAIPPPVAPAVIEKIIELANDYHMSVVIPGKADG